jgi:hypothetical protein
MKSTILAFFLIIIMTVPTMAKTGYVISRVCPVYTSADYSADRIGMLRQTEKVDVVSTSGDWLKVTGSSVSGFVQKIFIGDSPNIEKDTSMQDRLATLDVRKRASSYSSSAAAARGLASEDVRDRENVSFRRYDFESIKWVEEFTFDEDVILDFATVHGLL